MFPFFEPFAEALARWLQDRRRLIKRVLGGGLLASLALGITAFLLVIANQSHYVLVPKEVPVVLGGLAALLVTFLAEVTRSLDRAKRSVQIERVEQQARDHPERPQLAWDLARSKLENYLDRNLSQVRSIYWLTLVVMTAGFSLILYGLVQSFNEPTKLGVSIVASASGVLVSFIGGSFLLIYKSILAQSREYVSVLERINAVGMAVQVLASISEENKATRDQSTAELSRQLLAMYSGAGSLPRIQRRAAAKPRANTE